MSQLKELTFNSADIDQALWEKRTLKEATLIFNKPSTRKDRTWEKVYETCKVGQAAEVWLMSNGYLNDSRNYHDVLRPDGTPIEVKVTSWESRYILDRYAEKLKSGWGDWPKTVYVFYNSVNSPIYTFHGIFQWDGEKFLGYRPQL